MNPARDARDESYRAAGNAWLPHYDGFFDTGLRGAEAGRAEARRRFGDQAMSAQTNDHEQGDDR